MPIYLASALTTSADPFEGTVIFPAPIRWTRGSPENIHSAYAWAPAGLGGKTATLQVSPDYDPANPSASNWFAARRVDESNAIWTQPDNFTVFLRAAAWRVRLTGAGTVTNFVMVVF